MHLYSRLIDEKMYKLQNKNKMKRSLTLITCGLLFVLTYAQPKVQNKIWEKVNELSDEFNGSEIDEKKWNLGPDGHSELNWKGRVPALFQKESFGIADGKLTIEVGKLPKPIRVKPIKKFETYKYYGGILRSFVSSSIGHYYECRMKMNKTEMEVVFGCAIKELVKISMK